MNIGDEIIYRYALSPGLGKGRILKIFKKSVLVQPHKKGAPSFTPNPYLIMIKDIEIEE